MKKKSIFLLMLIFLLPVLMACGSKDSGQKYETLEDLQGKTLSMTTGNGSFVSTIEDEIGSINVAYYENYMDTFIAVNDGRADFSFTFKALFPAILNNVDGLTYIESNVEIPIVMAFSSQADPIRQDFNKYVAEAKADGTIDALASKWLDGYGTHTDYVDYDTLTGENGTITIATSYQNVPAEYLQDGHYAGFEPAVLYDFCQKYGYKVNSVTAAYDSIAMGLTTGKYDMGLGYYGYTDERSEGLNFSDVYYTDHYAYVVKGDSDSSVSFSDYIKNAFYKNFIKESRWKLLVNGLLVTLTITFLSLIFGTGIGFLLFLVSYRKLKLPKILTGINSTLEAMPALVILMVFFYGIFGSTKLTGTFVSIIVFSLLFAFSFFVLMSNCASGVPEGHNEAALALGYTQRQALFKVILPQTRRSFIPAYKSSIIALLKSTAIVGYVAVQDLTKGGDLIRSFTFDAFMPLIAVALIYYLLAQILIFILNRIFILTEPDGGKRFLKEVDHADSNR